LLCRPLAHLINFRYVPSDWRILFNNVIAIGWTTYLSFTCGGPSVVSPGGVEVAATAASTLLSVLPCHKVDDAMSLPGVGEAVQHVAAIEHIISCWGTKVGGVKGPVDWAMAPSGHVLQMLLCVPAAARQLSSPCY
jgi:hypothetical protein